MHAAHEPELVHFNQFPIEFLWDFFSVYFSQFVYNILLKYLASKTPAPVLWGFFLYLLLRTCSRNRGINVIAVRDHTLFSLLYYYIQCPDTRLHIYGFDQFPFEKPVSSVLNINGPLEREKKMDATIKISGTDARCTQKKRVQERKL